MRKTDDSPTKSAEALSEAPVPPAPPPAPDPIPMVLYCPSCGVQHIDAPEPPSEANPEGWDNPPHRTHRCHGCAYEWRPADVPTVGVLKTETTGSTTAAPLARAIPANGLDAHNLRGKVLAAREHLDRVSEDGGQTVADGVAAARAAVDELALLAGLPYTELPR